MLTIVKGDATQPKLNFPDEYRNIIIPHICNDVGAWGAGFVMALSKVCKEPERQYRLWVLDKDKHEDVPFVLGQVQLVPYKGKDSGIQVANMIAQRGINKVHYEIKTATKTKMAVLPPIRYDSLRECMYRIAYYIGPHNKNYVIHCPRFGGLRAGGSNETIEKMIKDIWVDFAEIDVTIYDFDE